MSIFDERTQELIELWKDCDQSAMTTGPDADELIARLIARCQRLDSIRTVTQRRLAYSPRHKSLVSLLDTLENKTPVNPGVEYRVSTGLDQLMQGDSVTVVLRFKDLQTREEAWRSLKGRMNRGNNDGLVLVPVDRVCLSTGNSAMVLVHGDQEVPGEYVANNVMEV